MYMPLIKTYLRLKRLQTLRLNCSEVQVNLGLDRFEKLRSKLKDTEPSWHYILIYIHGNMANIIYGYR